MVVEEDEVVAEELKPLVDVLVVVEEDWNDFPPLDETTLVSSSATSQTTDSGTVREMLLMGLDGGRATGAGSGALTIGDARRGFEIASTRGAVSIS